MYIYIYISFFPTCLYKYQLDTIKLRSSGHGAWGCLLLRAFLLSIVKLTLPAPCISKSCIKMTIFLNFYFHTSVAAQKFLKVVRK